MIMVNNLGPQISPTVKSKLWIGAGKTAISGIAARKKLISMFNDSAPKASQGSRERVSGLSGRRTARVASQTTYQCWNQNVPTSR